jgi:hypothetical protein
MNQRPRILFVLAISLLIGATLLFAQDSNPLPDTPECNPTTLTEQQAGLAAQFPIDFETEPETARDNLFRLGATYQMLALQCGYVPTADEKAALIEQTLSFATVAEIIAANSVGTDIEAILTELDTVHGDLSNGQLLYNDIETGLDGSVLGCLNCHNGTTAPATEGTWTRVDEIRLSDPALADYDVRRYLVESIIHPNDYVVPEFLPNLMPANFGSRLDIQMLADIVAYLESQDQFLDE